MSISSYSRIMAITQLVCPQPYSNYRGKGLYRVLGRVFTELKDFMRVWEGMAYTTLNLDRVTGVCMR